MSRTKIPTCEYGFWSPGYGGCPDCGPTGPCKWHPEYDDLHRRGLTIRAALASIVTPPAFERDTCQTPTTCAWHGRCMPIISQNCLKCGGNPHATELCDACEAVFLASIATPPTAGPFADGVEAAAREALSGIEVAHTEVVRPSNGTAPYSFVTFAGARIEFQQTDFSKYHQGSVVYDAATDKAAAQAQRINDLLLGVAKRAAVAAFSDGLKAAAKACEQEEAGFLSTEYSTGQPLSSFHERFACRSCATAIRALALTPTEQQGK